jgi:hypothetical protein
MEHKTSRLGFRITPKERIALRKWAAYQQRTESELLRDLLLRPALQFDPRQKVLNFGDSPKKEHPQHARTG